MEETSPERGSEKRNLRLRIVTGVVYCAVLLAFFVLKIFIYVPGEVSILRVGNLLFDVLILLFSFFGTAEMLRAFGDRLHGSQKTIVFVFALLVLLSYSVSDFVFHDVMGVGMPAPGADPSQARGRNYSLQITFVVFMAGIALLFGLLVFAHERVTLESTACSLLSYIYPSFFLLVLEVCNHLELYSELAILFVFVICPFADSLAFVFGKLFGKKLPARMAPNVSPKKTLIGGFGGLIGGAIGAVVIYFICYGLAALSETGIIVPLYGTLDLDPVNVVFYIALGIVTAAFSQFGDLVESAIKRKLGIKDMGTLLPGHGGILDRIDSSLYAGPIVCLVMVVRIMIVG